jgi:hypothetical protein|tara:strand:+ start:266 stop:418 length:153 start_codon:yes stop_codon:yes gene_type:complete
MFKYGMSMVTGSEIIAKTTADDLTSAYIHFSKLKNMPLDKFKKIFIVTKL